MFAIQDVKTGNFMRGKYTHPGWGNVGNTWERKGNAQAVLAKLAIQAEYTLTAAGGWYARFFENLDIDNLRVVKVRMVVDDE